MVKAISSHGEVELSRSLGLARQPKNLLGKFQVNERTLLINK